MIATATRVGAWCGHVRVALAFKTKRTVTNDAGTQNGTGVSFLAAPLGVLGVFRNWQRDVASLPRVQRLGRSPLRFGHAEISGVKMKLCFPCGKERKCQIELRQTANREVIQLVFKFDGDTPPLTLAMTADEGFILSTNLQLIT